MPVARETEHRLIAPALALATVVAAALRLPFLGGQSLWFDETYTATVTTAGGPAELWDRIGASESTPPLFYLLTWISTSIFGDGEAALRAVSAAALVAAVPAAYLALRRLTGGTAALAAAWIVAVSPMLVRYSLDARAYGLLVLLSLLSVWALAALLEHPTRRRWALWALAATAAIWTHWFAGFIVLAEVAVLLWLRPQIRRHTAIGAGIVLAALLPLVPLLIEQTGDDRAAFITQIGIVERLEQLVRQFALGPNVPRTWLEALGLALALGGAAIGTLELIRRARRRTDTDKGTATTATATATVQPSAVTDRDGARALLALAAIALAVPLALAASGIYDRFNPRNVLFAVPLVAGVIGVGLTRLRGIGLIAYLCTCLAATVWIHADWRYQNTDWRAALEGVPRAAGTPLVAATVLGGPVAEHYLDREPATGPLETDELVLVVEPVRAAGSRELAPVADPGPTYAALLDAFPERRESVRRGFRIIELRAPQPVRIDPAQLPGATLLPPAKPPR